MHDPLAHGPLAGLIVAMAGKLLNHPNSKANLLKRDWRRAVGAIMALHTEPVKLQNGILTVRVDSSAWLTELTFLAPEILQKLQPLLPPGTLKEIRFKQESLRAIPPWMIQKSPRLKLPPPLPAEQAKAETLTAIITDPPLKTALTRFLVTDQVVKRIQSTAQPPKSTPPAPPYAR